MPTPTLRLSVSPTLRSPESRRVGEGRFKGGRWTTTERRGDKPFARLLHLLRRWPSTRRERVFDLEDRTATTTQAFDGAGRSGTANEAAGATLRLLSPYAEHVTGQAVQVGGEGGCESESSRVLPSPVFHARSTSLSRHRESLLVSPARDWPSTSHVSTRHPTARRTPPERRRPSPTRSFCSEFESPDRPPFSLVVHPPPTHIHHEPSTRGD